MTENPGSIVDTDAYAVRRTIDISAPLEKVWAAVTEAEHLAKWFPQHVTLGPVAVGATGSFAFDGHGEFPVRVEELDPPHAITYRWGNSNGSAVSLEDSTTFRFTLEATDAGTRLTVVESGFDILPDPAASMEGNRGGWDYELDELVAYLEGAA